MITATFGTKIFQASPSSINTPDSISISNSLNLESQDVEGSKPATYIKGFNLIALGFDINLNCLFADVLGEISWWNWKLQQATPENLTIGGQVISYNKFLLKSVDISDLLIGKDGLYIKAKVSAKFEEYVSKGYKKNKAQKKTKKSGMNADDIKALEAAYNDY